MRRAESAISRRPLTRRPKALTERPQLFDARESSGGGEVLIGRKTDAPMVSASARGRTVPGATDESGALSSADLSARSADVVVKARAIASRMSVRRPADRTKSRGVGDLTSLPYTGGGSDIDIERTLELLVHRLDRDDIAVRDRQNAKRTIVLIVDCSGSMRGERLITAAATVGALAGQLSRDELGVIAFWSDAAVLLNPGEPVNPASILETLSSLPARGLTNIAFPLEIAAAQFAGSTNRESRALLLSDCVHNAGPDPRPLAGALPRLDILFDTSGEKDLLLARQLATAGRGRLAPVASYREVAPAVSRIFAS